MKSIKSLLFTFLFITTIHTKLLSYNEYILVEKSATKHVFIPHENIGNEWKDLNYADSTWRICEGLPGGVGYEKGSGYENLISLDVGDEMHNDGGNPNTGCYIRIPFTVTDDILSAINVLKLKMQYDDGFIAYINGHEAKIENAVRFAAWNYAAPKNVEANSGITFNITNFLRYLVPGKNLLAIHGVNRSTNSSDFIILPELIGSDDLYGNLPSSNLPIFLIDTDQEAIPDEPKLTANLKILHNEEGNLNHPTDTSFHYNGKIGIEIRGASSSGYPQTPYGFETRDELGENLNVPLLGMPAENDWCLISNYNEKSLVRNSLAFDLFRDMGHYAPRSRLCDVYLNASYRGIYLFTEKIKRDKNRIDIATLTSQDISGDELTGGYIFKIDYYWYDEHWVSNFHPLDHPGQDVHFVYYSPKASDLKQEQKSYIQNFIFNVENALYATNFNDPDFGYRKYIDVNSFIDYFIVSEVSRNVDGYKKSRFLYKDKDSNGGLLKAGPVWDFDWAWKNITPNALSLSDGSGWTYLTNDIPHDVNPPGWYRRFLQDADFTNQLIDRYFELRANLLNLDRINTYIDSVYNHVTDVQERHFDLWPINQGYMAPESYSDRTNSYEQEISKLKNWINTRIIWMDENIGELQERITTSTTSNDQYLEQQINFKSYPNPAKYYFNIESNKNINEIKIYNLAGQQVFHSKLNSKISGRINIESFPSGMYFIKIIRTGQKPIIYKQIFTE